MIEINLLPWREEQIKAKNRLFALIATIIALFCAGICFFLKYLYSNENRV